LFLHALHGCFGQQAAIRANHAFAILGGRLLGIEIHGEQSRNGWDRGRVVSESDTQDFIKIGRGVRGDQQDFLASIGKLYCGRACHRRFANTPFTCEEKIACWMF
jgi:hypothetical protein